MKHNIMNTKIIAILLTLSAATLASCRKVEAPSPCGPVPSENQMKIQDMETYAFLHYSMNTYTDEEWGYGNEDLALFNPARLDARQWVRTCKSAGMKGTYIKVLNEAIYDEIEELAIKLEQ